MSDEDFDTPDFNTSTPPSDNMGDNVMKELDKMAGLPDDEPKEETSETSTDDAEVETAEATTDDQEDTEAPREEKPKRSPKPQRGQAGTQRSLLNTFLQENEDGDLIDHNNNIIAKKGPARLHFERMKKEGRDALHKLEEMAVSQYEVRNALQGLYEDYKKLESDKTVDRFQDLQINDDETAIIRRMIPMFRSDPVKGIKALLTEVAARGTDLKKLGMNDALDVATVRSMVQEAIQGATKTSDKDTISEPAPRQADPTAQAERFLADFPDAEPFVDQIAQAARQFPEMSLPQIWLNLRRAIVAAQERQQTKPKTGTVRKQAKPRPTSNPKPRAHDSRRSYRDIAADLLKETQNG